MMKKTLLTLGIIGLFCISFGIAGYVINGFTVEVGVEEPLVVGYTFDQDCENYSGGWDYDFHVGDTINFGDELNSPGDSKTICVRIDNEGDHELSYSIIGSPNSNCEEVFGVVSMNGTVGSESSEVRTIELSIANDSPEVTDCSIDITVDRY